MTESIPQFILQVYAYVNLSYTDPSTRPNTIVFALSVSWAFCNIVRVSVSYALKYKNDRNTISPDNPFGVLVKKSQVHPEPSER